MARNSHELGHRVKREEIIAAAAEVFYERGFDAGTTKEIATRVGLSQPAIYHYVGSKETLLREIALQVDHEMTAALGRALDRGSTPREQLRAVVEEFTAAVIDNRRAFAVYYKELHALPPDVRRRIADHERDFVAGVATVVVKLQRDDDLPEDKSTIALTEAIVGMVSWVHRWYRASGPLDAAAISDVLLSLIGLSQRQRA